MNREVPPDSDLWPPSVARRLDAACNDFEAAWRGGRPPRIEDILDRTCDLPRGELLAELLGVEREYRVGRGEAPTESEYLARFPEHAEVIRVLFGRPADVAAALNQAAVESDEMSPSTAEYSPSGAGKPRPASGLLWPRVPGYEFVRVLGQGGMGIVYLARQVSLKRLVALKMLLAETEAEHQQARFRLEAESVARLAHPNIVQIYEIGEHAGRTYLALEYVEGGSLDQQLRGGPLAAEAAAGLVEMLASAVHHAHEQGVVHRDLKPANILLQIADCGSQIDRQESRAPAFRSAICNPQSAIPKITDFGLAKQLGADSAQTASGAIVGTPNYMSPEQAIGAKEVGPAADIHALGLILYECLTGRSPFQGAHVLDVLEQVRSHEPVPPSRLQPKVPRDLETICLKCLRKEPPRRYASALELADDLRRFAQRQPIRARPTPAWERGLKWARRQPAAAALLAVLVLAALGAVAGTLLYQDKRARVAEHEVRQLQQRDERQALVVQLLQQGQGHARDGRWQEAKGELDKAWAILDAEPLLDGWRDAVRRERDVAERNLAAARARADAAARRQRFTHGLEEARLHGTLLLSAGPSFRPARDAATQALALFGVTPGKAGEPAFTHHHDDSEKAEVRAGCHELLLLLAEIEAQAGTPAALRQAVALLDQSRRFAPPSRAAHLRRARYLARLGDHDGAARENERALALAPASALDHFLLGDEKQRGGSPESLAEAARHFETAVRLQPDHFWAHFFLAVCYLRQQQTALARGPLNACLMRRPRGFPWAYLLRGFVHGQQGELSAAEADFLRARKEGPDEAARYEIALNMGILRTLQRKYPEAAAELTQAVALRPAVYQGHRELAEMYRRQGKMDEALAQIARGLKECQAGRAELHRFRAGLHRQRQDHAAALRDLEQALAADGPPAEAGRDHLARGHALHELARYPEAVAAYQAALRAQPALAAAQLGCARAYLAHRRPEDARRCADAFLSLVGVARAPAEAFRLRATARAWALDFAGAAEDYGRAVDREPDAVTYNLLGWAHLFQGGHALAGRAFDKALALDRGLRDAYAGRAFVRARQRRYADAAADVERAVGGQQVDDRTLCNAARALVEAANQMRAEAGGRASPRGAKYESQALELLRRAVRLQPAGEREAFVRRLEVDAVLRPLRGHREWGRLATDRLNDS